MKRYLVNIAGFAALGVVVNLAAACPAYAYLDAGSSAVIFQAIIAGVVGGAVAIRLFWSRIVGLFKPKKAAAEPEDRTGDGQPSEDA